MNMQDTARLLKIDEQLTECEAEILKAVEYEQREGKNLILMSKVYKTKYDRLYRMRQNLMRSVNDKTTRRQTYSMILEQRKAQQIAAEEELKKIEQDIVQLAAMLATGVGQDEIERFKLLKRMFHAQKLVVANKQRAVSNWLAKDENIIPISRATKMKSAHGKFKEKLNDDVVKNDIHHTENFLEQDPMERLRQARFWEKPSVKDSQPSIDAIQQPVTMTEIVEEPEEKTIANKPDPMDPANMQYKPTIIDLD